MCVMHVVCAMQEDGVQAELADTDALRALDLVTPHTSHGADWRCRESLALISDPQLRKTVTGFALLSP